MKKEYRKGFSPSIEEKYRKENTDCGRISRYETRTQNFRTKKNPEENILTDEEMQVLDIVCDEVILAVAETGLWDMRVTEYREIASKNIRDCFLIGKDIEFARWYLDTKGDLKCEQLKSDGADIYLYRSYRKGLDGKTREMIREKISSNTMTKKEFLAHTESVGKKIAEVYGLEHHTDRKRGKREER